MKWTKMVPGILRDRIFVSALLLSAAWHIFWLSSVKVIVMPEKSGVAKFSKVSFLGTILEKGVLEVRVGAGQRSFLEKRYLDMVERYALAIEGPGRRKAMSPARGKDFYNLSDNRLSGFIRNAINDSKLEPPYGME